MNVQVDAACAYELDDRLNLIAVDESWSAFAIANGAPELAAPAPLGISVLASISDDTTRHLYEQLFHHVRTTLREVVIPIRCDGPGIRRYLDLHIAPRDPSGLRIHSVVVKLELQSAPLLESVYPRSGEKLVMCSWCKAIKIEEEWSDIEYALVHLRLFEQNPMPMITHSICGTCYAKVVALV